MAALVLRIAQVLLVAAVVSACLTACGASQGESATAEASAQSDGSVLSSKQTKEIL